MLIERTISFFFFFVVSPQNGLLSVFFERLKESSSVDLYELVAAAISGSTSTQ